MKTFVCSQCGKDYLDHKLSDLHQQLADWHNTHSGRLAWKEIQKDSAWVKLDGGMTVFRVGERQMTYGQVQDTRISESRSNASNPWRTTDGELHESLTTAKLHEVKTETRPRLIKDGFMLAEITW